MSTPTIPPDAEIELIFNWFLSHLAPGEWEQRKASIETYLESIFTGAGGGVNGFTRVIGPSDQIAWYLYLVETSLFEPFRTEVNQAARVLPVFQQLGADFEKLRAIDGIDAQVTKLLTHSKQQPDSVLFEMLIALLWAKNEYKISFIPPSKSEKRPDILASKGFDEWKIETKRLTATSGYAVAERDKWLVIWRPVRDCIRSNLYPFILDVTFHVELQSLPDDFLATQINNKLRFVTQPCVLVSNENVTVEVRFVDLEKIHRHLEDNYVKYHSRQMQLLVGGSWERKKGFTQLASAQVGRINGERGVNFYVESIDCAAGAYWHCDAERAIEAKARDIRGHLADAVKQLPKNDAGIIHVGIETRDGEAVEAERFERISSTTSFFNPDGRDLRWVFVHLFESYAPVETAWICDETIYKFSKSETSTSDPLTRHGAFVSWKAEAFPTVLWLREAP